MAITKLSHLKESRKGSPARHLKHALTYILNPDKTSDGTWVGGSCLPDPEEAFQCMMQTKQEFGKEYGRQGYHFVISFAPGECDEKTAFLVGKEFCERYFGGEYQYVFAVHNDQAHMHCHIVFNSVSQIDGRKYRYEAGDWEKSIQPITDALTKKYGLQELTYERDEKKGISYAERAAEKNGRLTWKEIIRLDIDAAIVRADTFEEYLEILTGQGYEIHHGNSEKHGSYYSYLAPGADRARRDFRLGPGYREAEICARIRNKSIRNLQEPSLRRPAVLYLKGTGHLQVCFLRRVRQAVEWRYFAFRRSEQARVRKDIIRITQLSEECSYLIGQGLTSIGEVKERHEEIKRQIRQMRRRSQVGITGSSISTAPNTQSLAALYREKRIVLRILKDADLSEQIKERPYIMEPPHVIRKGEILGG